MMSNIILLLILILSTFPFSHIFMKKGMIMDYNLTDEKEKDLGRFFYIPFLNVIVTFLYLIWVIVKFKRPE